MPASTTTEHPAKELRSGKLKVAIWQNSTEQDGQTVLQYSVTWQKRYRDRQSGEWKNSQSLFPEETLMLAELLRFAYQWIAVKETNPSSN